MAEELDREGVAKMGAKGAVYNIGAAGIAKIASLLFYVVLLRFVSDAEGGIYFLVIAVSGFIAMLGAFGMADSLFRFIPYYEGRGERGKVMPLVFTVMVSFTVFAALLVCAAYLSHDWVAENYNRDFAPALWMTVAIGVSLSFGSIVSTTLLGLKRFRENAWYSTAQPVLKIIAMLGCFFYSGASLENALYATLVTVLVVDAAGAAVAVSALRKVGGELRLLTWNEIGEVGAYGFAAMLSQFTSYVVGWTDAIVLGYYVAVPVLGAYSALIGMARTAMQTAAGQIFSVLTSMLSHAHGAKSELFVPLASNAARWSAYITLPVAIIGTLFAKEITGVLFPVYADYYWLLYFFIPGFLITVASFPARSALSAFGRTDLLFRASLFAVVPNIALNLALVPTMGVLGAVFATLISYTMSESAVLLYASRNARFSLHPLMGRALFPSLVMAAALWASHSFLFEYQAHGAMGVLAGIGLASALAFLLYCIALVKTGGLNETDKGLVEKVVGAALGALTPRRK